MDLIVYAGHKQRLQYGRLHRVQQAGPLTRRASSPHMALIRAEFPLFVLVMGELGAITINACEEDVEARLKELTDGEGRT